MRDTNAWFKEIVDTQQSFWFSRVYDRQLALHEIACPMAARHGMRGRLFCTADCLRSYSDTWVVSWVAEHLTLTFCLPPAVPAAWLISDEHCGWRLSSSSAVQSIELRKESASTCASSVRKSGCAGCLAFGA